MTPYELGMGALRTARGSELPPRSRGVIALLEENCTVCMVCARECPDWCIEIDSHKETLPPRTERGRPRVLHVLDRFAIDFALCMWCGICIEACPFDALFWSPSYDHATTEAGDLVHEREELRRWLQRVPPPPPLDRLAEPAKERRGTSSAAAALSQSKDD